MGVVSFRVIIAPAVMKMRKEKEVKEATSEFPLGFLFQKIREDKNYMLFKLGVFNLKKTISLKQVGRKRVGGGGVCQLVCTP